MDRKRSGGGALIDIGSHMIDLIIYCLDDKPKSVSCALRPEGVNAEGEVTATLLLIMTNGCHCSVSASFALQRSTVLQIYGTKGSVAMESIDDPNIEITTVDQGPQRLAFPRRENIYVDLIQEFEWFVLSKGVCRSEASSCMHASSVIDAAYHSANSGGKFFIV